MASVDRVRFCNSGSEAVMTVFDPRGGTPPVSHGGIFNANLMTMAAGTASMRLLSEEALAGLNALGDHARERWNAAFERAGVEGQATGAGSLVKLHMNRRDLTNHRDVFAGARERELLARLHRGLLDRGFNAGSSCLCAISTANTRDEIDDLAGALEDTLRDLRLNDPTAGGAPR